MTILPKKKHQETRKTDQENENDNIRNRHRNRSRDPRVVGRSVQQQEEISNVEKPSSPVYGDIESQEGNGLPHKRSRHSTRQSNFYHSGGSGTNLSRRTSKTNSREGSESPSHNEDCNEDGYNSSDEHGPREQPKEKISDENIVEQENEFEGQLREKKGFIIKQMATDGACMFRAVADQVYGDQEMHSIVRQHCMDYLVKNRDFFSPYITEDFSSYIRRKRNEHSHGNHTEMQALSEMYNRPIEVYQYSCEPINTFHSRTHNLDDSPPIRLSYHGNVHYNSVIDPYNPTVGVGLGLAGYKPKSEDDRLLKSASKESESLLLEQAMLEDKIKATDWEATDEHLAEIAARESYAQWLKDRQKQPATSSEASSSKGTSSKSRQSPPRENIYHHPSHETQPTRRSPPRRSPSSQRVESPDRHLSSSKSCDSNNTQQNNTASSLSTQRLSPPLSTTSQSSTSPPIDWSYALELDNGGDWGSDPVLAAVLAQSQAEYLQSFAKNKNCSDNSGGSCSKS